MSKRVSFKQIAPLADQLVCLDTDGDVWLYDEKGWSMLEAPVKGEYVVKAPESSDEFELGNRSSVLAEYAKQKGKNK